MPTTFISWRAWEELQPVSYRGEAHASYSDERIHTLGFVIRAGDVEFGPRSACFCPRCLARFAEENAIEEELTAQLVMENHESKWVDMWCRRWAELSAVYREGMHKAVPDGQMYSYNGYQTASARTNLCGESRLVSWPRSGMTAACWWSSSTPAPRERHMP